MVQAWTRGKHQTVCTYLLGQRQTVCNICLFSPSLDCTVAMTSRRNIPLPGHWDNSSSYYVKHTQSYSKTIKATYDLGEMEYLSIEKSARTRYHQCYSETGRIASALKVQRALCQRVLTSHWQTFPTYSLHRLKGGKYTTTNSGFNSIMQFTNVYSR